LTQWAGQSPSDDPWYAGASIVLAEGTVDDATINLAADVSDTGATFNDISETDPANGDVLETETMNNE
jgi:hypothetical protein